MSAIGDATGPIDGHIAQVPYYRYLGLRGDGAGSVILPANDDFVGDHTRSLLHGGVLAAFLEAAGVLFLWGSGDRPTTIACATDFIRAAPIADTYAAVTVVRTGRSVTHLRIDAHQGDPAKPVAITQGSWLV
jgi:acyl-coenzyme A thioesterase PaaI-like protein